MVHTKQTLVRRLRNRIGTCDVGDRYGKPLNVSELRDIAEFFGADVSDDDTKPEVCAKLANAAGIAKGATARDFPHGLKKSHVQRLANRADERIDDE